MPVGVVLIVTVTRRLRVAGEEPVQMVLVRVIPNFRVLGVKCVMI